MARWKRALALGAALTVSAVAGVAALGTNRAAPPDSSTQAAIPITADLNTRKVNLSAPAAELVNARTGQVLYARNVTARRYPASLVKLMTSLIALELVKRGQLTLHSIIPVSQSAYRIATTPGLSVAYLNPYERITLSRMLEYMYVVSADDAAVAIADDIAGNEREFARMMNAKAKELHMTGTHYTNASGLQNPQEYTTASDLVVLTRYLISHYPIVLKYASMRGMYIHPGQYGTNYDQLLGQFSGLDGLKTGSTSEAGYCFVGTAVRGGTRLISVVLGAKSFNGVFRQTSTLLGFGFSQFTPRLIQRAGQPLSQKVPVQNAADPELSVAPKENVYLSLQKGVAQKVSYSLAVPKLRAPVKAGQRIGVEDVLVNRHVVEQVPVYALRSNPKAGVFSQVWRTLFDSARIHARKAVNWVADRVRGAFS